MPLAAKPDDEAPYFAVVLVPGWEANGRERAARRRRPWARAMRAGSRRKRTRRSRAAEALYGYGALSRPRAGARRARRAMPPTTARKRARAAAALRHAAQGARVAIVSGGDPGVFAMAAAVCEEIEAGPASWRALDVAIVPGITAMLAVAARIGAPLGHDFCALSLSDNLKPWELIERRLDAAARRGLRDRALQSGLARAAVAARRRLRSAAPAAAAVDAGRLRPRGRAAPTRRDRVTHARRRRRRRSADMATLRHRRLARNARDRAAGRPPLVYTPRAAAEVSA